MQSGKSRLQYLVRQYADNLCTEEEMNELFSLIRFKENDDLDEEFLRIWNSIHPDEHVSSIDENQLFRNIEAGISTPSIRLPRFNWMRAAAAVLVLVSAGVLYAYFNNDSAATQLPTASNHILRSSHSLVKLPDGSSVLLNRNSTLDYAAFTGDKREVTLTGEAYFDIAKDEAHPFVIHTGTIKTQVLGTAFNIRAYPDETNVVVTVTRGKVKVETRDNVLGILTPNQQISFNKENTVAVKHQVLADSVITWKQKDLVFDNITFEEAAQEISISYGVQIRFANESIRNCKLYASFLYEDRLEQVLTVLCNLNDATYQLKDDTVIISGEGCK